VSSSTTEHNLQLTQSGPGVVSTGVDRRSHARLKSAAPLVQPQRRPAAQIRRVEIPTLQLKLVQARLGHATIQMTADRYGHLFPRGDDGAELAAAERAFLGG
jgi:integrase